jgi:large repetitive protein
MFKIHRLPRLVIWLTALLTLICAALASCCSSDDGPDIPGKQPQPPVASILAQPSTVPDALDVAFDAHESHDVDGTIVRYDWDFTTDGTYDAEDGGVTINFTYPAAGTYRCTVRVTDDDGLTDTASILVTVPLATNPPTAAGTATPGTVNPLIVRFDASTSFDTDGQIVRYDWDFDHDGVYDLIDGGPTPEHTFSGIGTYTVTVRVFDNDGLSDTAEITVNITQGQGGDLVPPDAVLTSDPISGIAPLGVVWDASDSTDSDGVIVRYDWDMNNDGVFEIINGNATRPTSYLTGDDYTVTVRVTDDDGGMDTASATVNVNDEPIALATSDPSAGDLADIQAKMKMTGSGSLLVTYDGSSSHDPDGEITQYDWDLNNDGDFEVINGGPTQQVNYTASGKWVVALRVTDNEGATDTASAGADVNEPPTARLQPDPPSGDLVFNTQSETWDLPVVWHASTSIDPDGTIVRYDWDMNNDGTFELVNQLPDQNVNYHESGIQVVSVRVTDNDGATEIATNSVDVNAPPVAHVVADPAAGNLAWKEGAETPTLTVDFDASSSTDSDGTIAQYDWDMNNDGIFEIEDGGPTQTYVFHVAGKPTVAVRVHDDDGATDNAATSVDINNPPTAVLSARYSLPAPQPPTQPDAAKGSSLVQVIYSLVWDASNSFDTDGTIVQYDWDTDNNGSFERIDSDSTITLDYTARGVYTVGVRVIDNLGAIGVTYLDFDVQGYPPVAELEGIDYGEVPLQIIWTAYESYDLDGTIVKYEWDYDNDGTYDEETNFPFGSYTYTTAGQKTCRLRVTDNEGFTGTATAVFNLTARPIAVLHGTWHYETIDPYRPYVVWDAAESYDPDGGNIVQYNWDLNDDYDFEVPDGGPQQTTYYTWSVQSVSAMVEVIDDEGETGLAYATVSYGQAAPIAMLQGYSSEGPLSVNWDASGSLDLDGDIVLYEFDADNDGTYEYSDTNPWYFYDYETSGQKTCRIRVTDDDGLTSTTTATYLISAAPTASLLGYISNFEEGLIEVTWDATDSFDPDGEIVQYEWDYDDDGNFDETTTEAVTIHVYQLDMYFTCNVRVTDNDGLTAMDSYTVYMGGPYTPKPLSWLP